MKIGCRCANCGDYFLQEEDDLLLEFDFKDMKISFICRNKKCKFENSFDMKTWQKHQNHCPRNRLHNTGGLRMTAEREDYLETLRFIDTI